jgi:hypothetical protein
MKKFRLWFLAVLTMVLLVLFIDWASANSQMNKINMDISVDSPEVIADGKNSVNLTILVTEEGRPRVNDLIQCYLKSGSGLLIPQWAFTDEDGKAQVVYTPTPFSPYDPIDFVVIVVMDTSIGRIVEVDKVQTVNVKLKAP